MSITADAVHFMHHSGIIKVLDSSFQGQGDDCFNLHGNFIVVDSVNVGARTDGAVNTTGAAAGANTLTYIDETGPGWITAAPTWFVRDEVQFYSRITLQPILGAGGGRNVITAATKTTVSFRDPIPAGVKQFDMFLSMKRIASLDIRNSFFGNSNSRGMLVSATSTVLLNNTFANLPQTAIDFFEGGCGAVGGQADYTEGPFSSNVLIENNTFINCSTAEQHLGASNNGAVIEIAGCRPIGECGISGFTPFIPSRAMAVPVSPCTLSSTSSSSSIAVPPSSAANGGGGSSRCIRSGSNIADGAYYSVRVDIPAGSAVIHTLKYAVANGAEHGAALIGLYNSSGSGYAPHPTTLLGSVQPAGDADAASAAASDVGFRWLSGTLAPAVAVDTGTYFVVLWITDWSAWESVATPGNYSSMTFHSGGGTGGSSMPASLGKFQANWTRSGSQGVPVVAEWSPLGDWCSAGGALYGMPIFPFFFEASKLQVTYIIYIYIYPMVGVHIVSRLHQNNSSFF